MNLNGTVALVIAVMLVVPGHIALRVANAISPRYSGKQIESLVLSLAYGSFIFCGFFWLNDRSFLFLNRQFDLSGIVLDDKATVDTIRLIVGVEIVLVLMSVVVGAILGTVRHFAVLDKLFNNSAYHLGVNIGQSSWDYMFERISRLNEALRIEIRCKDGSVVYGKFGSKSHASMAGDGMREIYLEEAYDVQSGSGVWTKRPKSYGVYVSCEDIASIAVYRGSGKLMNNAPVVREGGQSDA